MNPKCFYFEQASESVILTEVVEWSWSVRLIKRLDLHRYSKWVYDSSPTDGTPWSYGQVVVIYWVLSISQHWGDGVGVSIIDDSTFSPPLSEVWREECAGAGQSERVLWCPSHCKRMIVTDPWEKGDTCMHLLHTCTKQYAVSTWLEQHNMRKNMDEFNLY